MFDDSYIELSKEALENNIRFIQNILPASCKYSSVIKGNAYGHGIELFVPMAEGCEIDHFSTFSAEEAFDVRQVTSPKSQVMIMGMVENAALEWAILNGVEFWVFDMARLQEAQTLALKFKRKAKIHLEVETGMNRNGLPLHELEHVVRILSASPEAFELKGICSHYAGAESLANEFRIVEQRKRFEHARSHLNDLGLHPQRAHIACSAGVLRYHDSFYDMARIGIMQYGFFPTREMKIEYEVKHPESEHPLQRVLSWKSSVMSLKDVPHGNFVGYGTSYLADRDMRIATVPVGYWHGFSRTLSNAGKVLIGGKIASVLGAVNMNMISVDVTDIPGVEKGDEVVMIGRQGGAEITVSSFSEASEQVNYEMLTRLPQDIPRKLV